MQHTKQIDGDDLRNRMRNVGLTGRKAANILHMHEADISRALNDERSSTLAKIERLVSRREERKAVQVQA